MDSRTNRLRGSAISFTVIFPDLKGVGTEGTDPLQVLAPTQTVPKTRSLKRIGPRPKVLLLHNPVSVQWGE